MTLKFRPVLKVAFETFRRNPLGAMKKFFVSESRRRFALALRDPDGAGIKMDRPWQERDGIRQRQYDSYDDYLRHQAGKLTLSYDHLMEHEKRAYQDFRARFETCVELKEKRVVLCLAARLGTEVRAFQDLGHFAIGIDLEPGPKNPLVMYGDFHNLAFKDGSVDAVYCNALDHAFNLDKVMAEVRRVLAPCGIFIADVVNGSEEGHTPDNFDCTHWSLASDFAEILGNKSGLTLSSMRNLADIGDASWNQAVFCKG